MTDASLEIKALDYNQYIVFHFDVPEHSVPLNQFIDTAKSAQSILDNFNTEFFEGKLKYQINVAAPKEGGLIELLELDIYGFSAATFAFLCTPPGQRYVKGLTGQDTSYWLEKFGSTKRDAAKIIIRMIKGFLRKDSDLLIKAGLVVEKFRPAYLAKNRIFHKCLENPVVKGLGFDGSHDFEIKRSDFPKYILEVPEEVTQNLKKTPEWKVHRADIIVYSPVWKRDVKSKWKADTTEYKDISFSVEDEMFWHLVRTNNIKPKIIDNMQVQWAYSADGVKPTNVRVLKVLSHNGKKVSDPLSDEQLAAALGQYEVDEQEQSELFG